MHSGQLPRKLGLIVGINRYQDSLFRSLRFAENDAKELAEWFVNTEGGKWNPSDVQLIQGQYATKELVESLLAQLYLQIAKAGDEVLFYFAGHAFLDERSDEGYLALANTRYQDTSTALSVRTLIQSIQPGSRARRILCIFDCFQTGPVWDMRRTSRYDSKPLLGAAALGTLQQSTDRFCLCSCRGNAGAGETGESGIGTFTHRLRVGLSGPATESAIGGVTLTKLHAYLFNNLSEQHRPQLFGQPKSPFVLVGNPIANAASDIPNATTPSSPFPTGSGVDPSSMESPPHSSGGLTKRYGAQSSSAPTTASGGQAAPELAGLGRGQNVVEPPPHSRGGLTKRYGSQSSSVPAAASASQAASNLADSGQVLPPQGSVQKAAPNEPLQEQYKQILEQAQRCMQNQNYKDAFELVEQVLRIAPNNTVALTLKGQLLGTAGRLEDAIATVEQLLQNDPDNALAWSMRAVLLSNMGQQQAALSAIERSLAIDASNPESYAIRTRITESLAAARTQNGDGAKRPDVLPGRVSGEANAMVTKDDPRTFLVGAGLQMLGFILGIVGAASTYFLNQSTPYISLAIACLGLAIMCVLATRGAFRYGFSRLIPTVMLTILSAVVLGGGYAALGLTRIIANIQAQAQVTPQAAIVRLLAFGFIGIWLVSAAILPLFGSVIGLVAGFVMRSRQRG